MKHRALLFLAAASFTFSLPAEGAVVQEADRAQEEQRLQEIEEKLKANARDAETIRQSSAQREVELGNMREDLVSAADLLRESEERATNIERRLVDLADEIEAVQEDLDVQQLAVSDILAALQSLEVSKPPALAVSPDDASQAARAAMALSSIVPDLQARVDELRATIEKQAILKNELAAEQSALIAANQRLEERQRLLETLLTQKEEEYEDVESRIAQLESENTKLAQEATSIRELLNRLNELEKARELAAQAPPPEARPATPLSNNTLAQQPSLEIYNNLPTRFAEARGKLPYPVSGQLTRKFGTNNADGTKLEGLRIETRGGAVITAPFSGEVVFAERLGRLGNVFILDVGDKYHLVMIGMGTLEATVGQKITAGVPIGYMPGDAAREELHVEIRRNREPINPTRWFLANTSGD
jgi:septal ring factor EnvC (AmiA/AmiB activator)